MSKDQKISIVIPIKNESENIQKLTREINKACNKIKFEILFVNDGSDDNSINILKILIMIKILGLLLIMRILEQ